MSRFVNRIRVELVLGGALVPEPRDGDNADEDAEDQDPDAKERKLCGRVALVGPTVLVLERRGVERGRGRCEAGAHHGAVQDQVVLKEVLGKENETL